MREAIAHTGQALDHAFVDRLRLRVQPPLAEGAPEHDDIYRARFGAGRFSASLPAHRDCWASNLWTQLNYWSPLAPITAGRTLQLFPSFFEEQVPNSSEAWDFHELRRRRSEQQEQEQEQQEQTPAPPHFAETARYNW